MNGRSSDRLARPLEPLRSATERAVSPFPSTSPDSQHNGHDGRGHPVGRHEPARATIPRSASDKYLTFRLGAEEYGTDILKVQEIRSYEVPTRIADAAAYIKGVVNLRGVIVPIVDLRLNLGCEIATYDDFTVVII